MENKELIGRKVKGFAFETTTSLEYNDKMNKYIGKEGVICYYDSLDNTYRVKFNDDHWFYPASEIEKHLVEEKDWSVTINSPTQQIDQDLLDKFAIQSLPNIISRISINATHSDIAKECYDIARAMMKERSKNGN